jgi:ferrochelatase
MNMGGSRNKAELKEFLTNMFNDINIINIKNTTFSSMLANFIVKRRLDKAWSGYKTIGGCSPLHDMTDKLVAKLSIKLKDYKVISVMRYTQPNSQACIDELKQDNIRDVVLLPLYAQYSTTTTKSSLDEFITLSKNSFNITVIEHFYKNSMLNDIISDEIIKRTNNTDDFNLIFSAHGLPLSIVNQGDPYQIQIQEHIELVKTKLKEKNSKFSTISLAYQSKVGYMQWLTPSLSAVLRRFKHKKVLIYPISFMIDNSETLFELCFEYKQEAKKLGCQEYKVCSCANDNDKVVHMISSLL